MVGTAYPMKVSDALLATARDDPARAIAMVNAFSHSSLASKPSYPGPGAWLRGGAERLDAPHHRTAPRATCSSTTSASATPTPTASRPPPACAARLTSSWARAT